MMKIEVHSNEVVTRSGVSAKTGKSYSIREQLAYVHIPGKPFPVEFRITLDDSQPPYPKGVYALSPDSFYVGRYGELICRPRLVAAPTAPRAS